MLPLPELRLGLSAAVAAIVEFLALLTQPLKTSHFVCAATPQTFSVSHSEPGPALSVWGSCTEAGG